MKHKTYYISGMHCASCELLIENQVLEQPSVKAADASLAKGTLDIEYSGAPISIKQLNSWFKDDGYHFSETAVQEKKELLFYLEEGKQGIQMDKSLLKRKLKTLTKVLAVFAVLYLVEKSGAANYVSISEQSSLGLFFLFGIVAGLSSCAALIGGILLSLSNSWNEKYGYGATSAQKLVPHGYFHGGRIVAYAMFGGILGAVGQALTLDNVTIYASITMLVSVIMLLIGLQMAGVKWAERFQIRMPKFVTSKIANTSGEGGNQLPFVIGAGTVLLPCGFTLIAQGIALTSGSALLGASMMASFVIGTMIPLLLISIVSIRGSKNPKRARAFSFYAGVVLVIFAFYNMNGQLNVLGFPSVSDVFASPGTQDNGKALLRNAQGEQIVTLTAKGFSYTLTSASTIQAGVPTKLLVDDQGMQGCGVFLAARGLINGFVELKLGENIIDIGSPQAGTYKITCSMGMVRPVLLTVK